jgi:hypothetical protein
MKKLVMKVKIEIHAMLFCCSMEDTAGDFDTFNLENTRLAGSHVFHQKRQEKFLYTRQTY